MTTRPSRIAKDRFVRGDRARGLVCLRQEARGKDRDLLCVHADLEPVGLEERIVERIKVCGGMISFSATT